LTTQSGPRLLAAGWVGSTNLGDELIFAGIVNLASSMGASLVAISRDPQATMDAHGVASVPMSSPGVVKAAMAQADMVLWGGGGLLQDVTSGFNLPYHLSKVWMAKAAGTPVLPFGIDIGPLTTPIGRRLAKSAVPLMAPGLVRDRESIEEFVALGGERPSIAPDLAFALEPPRAAPLERIVVCLRPWAGGGRLPVSLSWNKQIDDGWFINAAAQALDEVAGTHDLPIHFLAMQPDRDDAVHERVAARMSSPSTRSLATLGNVLEEVARSRAVITMRYHGMVSAVLGGRPSVGIAYTDKVRRLAKSVGPEAARWTPWTPEGFAALPALVADILGADAAVIDVREHFRARMLRARSVIERTHHSSGVS
jgi:polysaccharide pyruvyl transferase CsaB